MALLINTDFRGGNTHHANTNSGKQNSHFAQKKTQHGMHPVNHNHRLAFLFGSKPDPCYDSQTELAKRIVVNGCLGLSESTPIPQSTTEEVSRIVTDGPSGSPLRCLMGRTTIHCCRSRIDQPGYVTDPCFHSLIEMVNTRSSLSAGLRKSLHAEYSTGSGLMWHRRAETWLRLGVPKLA